MKKVLIILLSFLFMSSVDAAELVNVELINCDSVSNIWMKIDNQVTRVKLLAYDEGNGSLNNEINEYACNVLKNARTLEVEYDPSVLEKDAYNRSSLWVYVDSVLLQEMLIQKGYGQVNFVTGDYLYTNNLCEVQKEALSKGLGIWTYPEIKEAYCQSGISINNKDDNKKDEDTKSNIDAKSLWFLVLINSCIVILLLVLKKR